MPHEQLLVVQYDPEPFDPDSDGEGTITAIGARLNLAAGELGAVRLLQDRTIHKDYRVSMDCWFAGAIEELIGAGRDDGATILASHGAGGLAAMFPTLAPALTPNDPRWVCTQRLAPHFWPDADHPDIAVLVPRLGLAAPPADPDFRYHGFYAACTAVLLGRVCRALAEAGHAVTPALLRDWSRAEPQVPAAGSLQT